MFLPRGRPQINFPNKLNIYTKKKDKKIREKEKTVWSAGAAAALTRLLFPLNYKNNEADTEFLLN